MASLKRNFVFNSLNNATRIIFPLITAPYVARVLEPDGVGLYNFSMTYAGYFALVALLGVPTYGVREVAKVKDNFNNLNKLVSELFSIVTMSTIIVTSIYFVSLLLIGQLKQDYLYFIIAGLGLYFSPFQTNWFYQGLEEFDYITIRSIIVKVFSIVSLFVFVKSRNDIAPYIFISVMGTVLADIWNYVKMREKGISPKLTFNNLRPHIKPLLILFSSAVAISIYTILDTLMLGFLKDYTEVGYYSNAINLSKIFLTLVTSLSVVSVPRFSFYISKGLYEDANKMANRSFAFVGFLSVPITVGLVCIAPVFVPWFFGIQFNGAILPLQILSFLNIAIGFSNLLGLQVLVGIGKDKCFLKCVLYGTASNFILNCILIPLYGAIGASIASVISEFIVAGSMLYYVYTETPVRLQVSSDIVKSSLGALLLFLLFKILPLFDEGILYLIIAFLSSVVVYMLSQWMLHNGLLYDIAILLKNKIVKYKIK